MACSSDLALLQREFQSLPQLGGGGDQAGVGLGLLGSVWTGASLTNEGADQGPDLVPADPVLGQVAGKARAPASRAGMYCPRNGLQAPCGPHGFATMAKEQFAQTPDPAGARWPGRARPGLAYRPPEW
jgi:hypothetical protein